MFPVGRIGWIISFVRLVGLPWLWTRRLGVVMGRGLVPFRLSLTFWAW